ncbi:extracellular matrix protein 2-like [Heterodontus francisci]|uniref:extracellular matrix protein 2-like n=1 Tax=Heterodontus francisci TaxID=7792 RepID=UPI00355C338B
MPSSQPAKASEPCVVNGLTLYQGAVWSPRPCTVCACEEGQAICEDIECPATNCRRSRRPPGQCCPVCLPDTTQGDTATGSQGSDAVLKGNRKRAPANRKEDKRGPKDRSSSKHGKAKESARVSAKQEARKPEKNTKKQELHVEKEDLHKIPRLGLQQQGAATKTKGLVPKKRDVGVKKPEVVAVAGFKKQDGPKKQGVLPIKQEESRKGGKKKQEAAAKKQEVGPAVGTKKQEIAPQRQEVEDNQLGIVPKRQKLAAARARGESTKVQEVGPKKEQTSRAKTQVGAMKQGAGGVKTATMAERQPLKSSSAGKNDKAPRSAVKTGNVTATSVPFPQELLPPPESEFNMPSLPVGCILAENAIACPAGKLTEIPMLVDPGLHTLYLADNGITTVSASDLAGLPNLQWLDLSRNRIGDERLDRDAFRNLTRLRRLNLDGNRISQVPRLPPSLEELKVNDNRLEVLDRSSFRGLHRLLTLELEGNGLNDGNVNPNAFRPLRKLIYLRLGRNRFRAMPSGLPPSLRELHLESNHIEEVPGGLLNKTLNLTILVLRNNRIQENRIAPRAWIHLRKLETLDLSHNRLVHVPSFLPMGLKQLLLHHNQIERIPGYVFAHLKPGLEFLHLSYNRLSNDGIHGISFLGLYKSLHELLLDHNQLKAVPRGILNLRVLQVLRLSDNQIRYIPLDSVCNTRISEDSSLVSIHLENNLIDRRLIPPIAFSCIRSYQSVVLRPQRFED